MPATQDFADKKAQKERRIHLYNHDRWYIEIGSSLDAKSAELTS